MWKGEMLKALSKVKIEFNALDPRLSSCMEFLAQCNSRQAKDSNPSCQLLVKRRTDDHPPQITVTFTNGAEHVFDATSTTAHSIRSIILDKSRELEAKQMFLDSGEKWPVLIPEDELHMSFPGTKRKEDQMTVSSPAAASLGAGKMKTVLITGAGKGLGRALALELAKRGHTVIGCSRSQDNLNSLQSLLDQTTTNTNPRHLLLNADVVFPNSSLPLNFLPFPSSLMYRSNSSVEELARAIMENKGVPPDIIGTAGGINGVSALVCSEQCRDHKQEQQDMGGLT
ncbi:hypothetical protein Tsubulata_010322 [Turnera subulata]|uniref:Large ribosomal subunit protein mL53 n=1 Tax=Turnera subulata TaxID=218843 RepID=A0A9Q0GBZ7_9ROSI|nr:hypothetical protein Tsubulata_010322 [Turnera subulata]